MDDMPKNVKTILDKYPENQRRRNTRSKLPIDEARAKGRGFGYLRVYPKSGFRENWNTPQVSQSTHSYPQARLPLHCQQECEGGDAWGR